MKLHKILKTMLYVAVCCAANNDLYDDIKTIKRKKLKTIYDIVVKVVLRIIKCKKLKFLITK